MVNLNEYQQKAITTAVYPKHRALEYLTLGLVGEAAEVANKVKKIIRGDYNDDPEAAEDALASVSAELGDVLWYIAVLSDELGDGLGAIAGSNLDKLRARAEAGTLKGSGDER